MYQQLCEVYFTSGIIKGIKIDPRNRWRKVISLNLDPCFDTSIYRDIMKNSQHKLDTSWNPSLLLQKKEILLLFLNAFGFCKQAKSLASTLKIFWCFYVKLLQINYNNQRSFYKIKFSWVLKERFNYMLVFWDNPE